MNLNREGVDLGTKKKRGLEQLKDDNLESSNWVLGVDVRYLSNLSRAVRNPGVPQISSRGGS